MSNRREKEFKKVGKITRAKMGDGFSAKIKMKGFILIDNVYTCNIFF